MDIVIGLLRDSWSSFLHLYFTRGQSSAFRIWLSEVQKTTEDTLKYIGPKDILLNISIQKINLFFFPVLFLCWLLSLSPFTIKWKGIDKKRQESARLGNSISAFQGAHLIVLHILCILKAAHMLCTQMENDLSLIKKKRDLSASFKKRNYPYLYTVYI